MQLDPLSTLVRRPRAAVALVCALALSGCGSESSSTGPEVTQLRGVVVRAGTEVLLADVPVQLDSRSTRSNDRGQYRFDEIDEGEATLSASFPGYLLYQRRIEIRPGSNSFDIALIPDG